MMIQLSIALRNLVRNRRRSLVVILTLILGVGGLFLYDGYNNGILAEYKDSTIHFKYGHGQLNTLGYREKIWEKPSDHWIVSSPALLDRIRALPGVTHVFPRIDFFSLITNGQINIAGKGTGIDGKAEASFFGTSNLVGGTNLNDQADGILLGTGLAKALHAEVGSPLTLFANNVFNSYNGVDVKVVGIFNSGIKDLDDHYFRIQLSLASQLLETDRVESIAIGLANDKKWPEFATAAQLEFPELEATPFEVLDKFFYQNSVNWLGQQFRIIMMIILFIVLLGITNTISFTVLERTREIGNLRANGESCMAVMGMLLTESLLMAIIGSIFGVAITYAFNAMFLQKGVWMPPPPGLTKDFTVKILLAPGWALSATIMGIVVALCATVLAGLRQVSRPVSQLITRK